MEVSRATALANPAPQVRQHTELLLDSCLLALRIEADEFLAYDRRLVAAARESGLAVASPGATDPGSP